MPGASRGKLSATTQWVFPAKNTDATIKIVAARKPGFFVMSYDLSGDPAMTGLTAELQDVF